QRHASLGVALRTAHLAAAEAAGAANADPLRARAHRGGERALHRTAEADAVLELLRNGLRDELRVELGTLDLVDVDVDVLAGAGLASVAVPDAERGVRFGFSSAGGVACARVGTGATFTVMWQVRLKIRLTRPRARGRQRLIVGPSST